MQTRNVASQILLQRRLHKIVKQTYHKIIYFYSQITKTIKTSTSNFDFAPLHLLEETSRIFEMMESLRVRLVVIQSMMIEIRTIRVMLLFIAIFRC